jgi:hypothetical protein
MAMVLENQWGSHIAMGARVANGSVGRVLSIDNIEGKIYMEFRNEEGVFYHTLERSTKTASRRKNGKLSTSSVSQFKIAAAHGYTAHKSQGQTLRDPHKIQCEQTWDSGQAYVMLSRASDPLLIRLVNPEKMRVFADPAVINFYARMNLNVLPLYAQ